MKGDRFCHRCKGWIGNYLTGETPDGEASYHSLIRAKYCSVCRPIVINEQTQVRLHNLRERNKLERKQEQTKIDLLAEENELLRQYVQQLREKLDEGG